MTWAYGAKLTLRVFNAIALARLCDGLSCHYNAITVPRRMMGEDNESSGAKARKRACCGFGGWAKDVEPR